MLAKADRLLSAAADIRERRLFGSPASQFEHQAQYMTLAEFINLISLEEYFVSGTYHEAARHSLALPAEGVGRFVYDGESLLFEGSYRHHRGTTSHPLSANVPLGLNQAGSVEVTSVPV